MSKIYLAAPLFDEMELHRNKEIADILELMGHEVYLPQRDSGEVVAGTSSEVLFKKDLEGLYNSDIVLALLDGRVPDEGTCFEMGIAYALKKKLYAYSTDVRSFIKGNLNVMLWESPDQIFISREELLKFFGGIS